MPPSTKIPAFACRSSRGTVSLVALCFVAVLGISLAGYIAVCSRAMQLSNRSFQANVSQQLAELGLEEALRAFNKNDWSDWSNNGYSADWTLDTVNKRATATLTIPTSNLGQGITATVKIRVDNYDAAHLGSAWSNSTNYRVNDLVGRNGVWYRCVKTHSSQTPNGMANLAYWAPAPIPWIWQPNVSYKSYDVVCYNGTWYRCTSAHTSPAAWTGTNWTAIRSISLYSFSGSYTDDDIVYFPSSTTWYRYSGGSWLTTAGISWQYLSGTTYSFNDVVYYYSGGSYNWYRYINATPTNGNAPTNPTYWENALSGTNTTSTPGPHGWSSSSINYNLRDTVYYSGQWYRCIKAHTSSTSVTPASTTYWTNTPLFSTAWDSGKQYSQNDTVRYNGVWYLSLQNSNVAQNPSTATTYWIGANTTNSSYTWNATTSYSAGAYRCYGGVWYKCLVTHSNKSPNDTTYWTTAWSNSWGITTGAPITYAEATVSIANNPTVKTQLRAPLAPAPLFPNAAGAITNLAISTGGGTVDSYDSSVAVYNSGTAGSSAVLAAGSTMTIGGATTVKGYLAWPSPPSGISSGTTLNGVSYSTDKSRVSRSPYIPQFDILPSGDLASSTIWNPLNKGIAIPDPGSANQTLNLGTPGATTPARYYYNGALRLDQGDSSYYQYLNINGPVILQIKTSFRIQSSGRLQINSSGSAQVLYGSVFRIYSGGELRNTTQAPQNLVLLTDYSSTDLTFLRQNTATPKDFHGVLYSPKIGSSVGVEIENGINIYGAISAKNVTFSDQANLHYDTSLRYATFGGVDQPYAVTEWRELPVTEQATMP